SIAEVAGTSTYNWTLPAGATITAGAGTRTITVAFGTNSGTISVTPESSCGNGSPNSLIVTVSGSPAQPGTITGNGTVCSGATGVAYSVPTVAGATSYTWTLPAGATIASGNNSNSITVNFGTSGGDISVRAVNTCGESMVRNRAISITSPAMADAGPDQYISTTTTTLAGLSTYGTGTWTRVNGSGNINDPSNPSTSVSGLANGVNTFMWTVSNSCGSSSDNVVINVGSQPVVTEINGPANVILGESYTYTVPFESNVSYVWSVPTGVTIVSGQGTNSLTVRMDSGSGGSIGLAASNDYGTTNVDKIISIGGAPAIGTIVSGPEYVQPGQSYTYNVPYVDGATYSWDVPAGANIISGQGTNSIVVQFSEGSSGAVSVAATNAYGTSNASTSVSVGYPPVSSEISGPSNVELGETYTYTVPNGVGVQFDWSVPAGAIIVSGQGTNSISVRFDSGSGGNINLIATNNYGITNSSKPVNIGNTPAIGSTVNGPEYVQPGQDYTYSVPFEDGVSYEWSVPAGATIVSGQGTNSVVVRFTDGSSGDVSVVATNPYGSSSAAGSVNVGNPPVNYTITGEDVVTSGPEYTYSIPYEDGVTYNWDLPEGATIVSGQGTNSITVVFAEEVSGNLTVTTSNNFGSSSSSIPILINSAPVVTGISGPAEVETNNTYTYSVPFNNGSMYHWVLPEGASFIDDFQNGGHQVTIVIHGEVYGEISVTESNPLGNAYMELFISTPNATSVADGLVADSYDVYPNPFIEHTTIRINSVHRSEVTVSVMDAKGVIINTYSSFYTNEEIRLGDDLTIGMFFVQLNYEDKVQIVKIIKL
ncbi:MAG: T9SS type A sorting domain-containing protein, partial [Cytophagaceae bacterium]